MPPRLTDATCVVATEREPPSCFSVVVEGFPGAVSSNGMRGRLTAVFAGLTLVVAADMLRSHPVAVVICELRRFRTAAPKPAKPRSNIAQVAGSGTAADDVAKFHWPAKAGPA